MMRCAEILNNHIDCDFVDINMGCPIGACAFRLEGAAHVRLAADLAIKNGYGSALLQREKRLKQIVGGVLRVLDKPLTVKLRTGFTNDRPIAHTLLPQLRDMGIVAATVRLFESPLSPAN